MRFFYKGRNAHGVIVDGVIAAQTKIEAIQLVRDSGITPFMLKEKRGFSFNFTFLFSRVSLSEKIMFAKNIAGMLRAGLSLSRALEILGKQVSNAYTHSVITSILSDVDGGSTFSESLLKHPKIFSSLFVAMVRAGEESGMLPAALSEIASNLEKTYALNRKIKSALIYPAVIFCAIIIIGILMFIYVVPTLISTFKDLQVQLPLSTRIVIGISDTISQQGIILLGGVILLGAVGVYGMRLPSIKRITDRFLLRIPVLGVLIKEVYAARTTRTLSSLLMAGVGIRHAIDITENVLQHSQYKKIMQQAAQAIEKGEPISRIFLEKGSPYPIMVGEMIQVGEETGKLSDMLSDVAMFYEGEVDAKTKDLSTIIEPVLMIVIGAAVGFFAVSMLSPMYSIMDNIK